MSNGSQVLNLFSGFQRTLIVCTVLFLVVCDFKVNLLNEEVNQPNRKEVAACKANLNLKAGSGIFQKATSTCEKGVSVPTITPSLTGGVFGDDFCLVLSGSKGSKIVYTKDGSEPKMNSKEVLLGTGKLYSSCVNITDAVAATTNIRAKAYISTTSGKMLESFTYSWTYTINKEVPAFTPPFTPAFNKKSISGATTPATTSELVFRVDVSSTFTLEKGGSGVMNSGQRLTYSTIVKAANSLYTVPVKGSDLEVGDNNLYLYVVNSVTGNVAVANLVLNRDDTAPDPRVNLAAGTYSALSGGAYSAPSTKVSVPATGEPHGVDAIYYTLDGTDPSTAPNEDCATNSDNRNSPGKRCYVDLSRSSTLYETSTFEVEPFLNGATPCAPPTSSVCDNTIVLKYVAVDAAGNESAVETVTYRVDTFAPTLTFTRVSALDECKSNDSWNFTLSANDDDVKYEIALGGSAPNRWGDGNVILNGTLAFGAATDLAVPIDCALLTENRNNSIRIRARHQNSALSGDPYVSLISKTVYSDAKKPVVTSTVSSGTFYPSSATPPAEVIDFSISKSPDSSHDFNKGLTIYITTDGTDPTSTNFNTSIRPVPVADPYGTISVSYPTVRTTKVIKAIAIDQVGWESDKLQINLDMWGTSQYNEAIAVTALQSSHSGSTNADIHVTTKNQLIPIQFKNIGAVDLNYLITLVNTSTCTTTLDPLNRNKVLKQGTLSASTSVEVNIYQSMLESSWSGPTVCAYSKLTTESSFVGNDTSKTQRRMVRLLPDTNQPDVKFYPQTNAATRFISNRGRGGTTIRFSVDKVGKYFVHKITCNDKNNTGIMLKSGSILFANRIMTETITYDLLSNSPAGPDCFSIIAEDAYGNKSSCDTNTLDGTAEGSFCGEGNNTKTPTDTDSGFIWRDDTPPAITMTNASCPDTTRCYADFNVQVKSNAVTCLHGVCPAAFVTNADTGTDFRGHIALIRGQGQSHSGINATVKGADTRFQISSGSLGALYMPSINIPTTGSMPTTSCCFSTNVSHCGTTTACSTGITTCSTLKPQATQGAAKCWGAWSHQNQSTAGASHNHGGFHLGTSTSYNNYPNDNHAVHLYFEANVTWRNEFNILNDLFTGSSYSRIKKSTFLNAIDWANATFKTYKYSGERIFNFTNNFGLTTSALIKCSESDCVFNKFSNN